MTFLVSLPHTHCIKSEHVFIGEIINRLKIRKAFLWHKAVRFEVSGIRFQV